MTVKAKKHLGQHFLKDEDIAKKIADSLTLSGYKDVLEIGPGMGVLTKYVIPKDVNVHVIEIDTESVEYLKTAREVQKLDFEILEADFLKIDLRTEFQNKQIAIIGNFPYNISSQIVFKAIENRNMIPEFSGMFQKEVAKRIAEKEGSKVYGILSVLTQAFYDVEYLFTVPPSVFNPPPKVDSGVIRLIRKENYTLPVNEKLFFRVVKTAFNQRRKMLRGSLKSFNLSDKLREDAIFAMRPEQLSVNQFFDLTAKIEEDGNRN
ncbi:16S rRNA (adenine(1518)-N(6)/adenine(1519)-N(6))-dimethyltransferase RsmA [Urechidicola vernalis]|uniref:Ribosomal RNA small subunit methyltransferase A n=1 Tax=Urechidicola vernalis TaxID=3075600 RepID=A0ABU2Y7Q3_9FLAO|nr:16S rRNA (adenine(1518)-N(6)/adenine(1519)-N(6))-dimethyltransferase RsmA [Urechidicola sp. P050]MDT0554225.1 16S rRNA (adenine(1518)-N(6)/adenine(1519)-N(6))-dimethyltransferase RsmA [Urechidicola sp. P050]